MAHHLLKLTLLLLLGCAAASAQAPSAPSNLVTTNGTGNNINLSWTDNSSNETGFKIERKLGVSGSYAQIDTAGAGATTYADNSSKTANRPYIYRVRATNGSGDSAYSNEDDATTPYLGAVPNYRTDSAVYLEQPTTMPLPLAGGKFYDETFGTQIMRFTDEADGLDFGTTYSVWPTPNCDNTKVFMYNSVTNSYYIGTLNPATFSRVGALAPVTNPPATLFAHLESAFWSFTDPDKLYVVVDAKIYYYRPSTATYTLLKDLSSQFPAGYYFIQLYVSSDDNRFGAMFRNSSSDQGFMVYELSSDTTKLRVNTTDMNGITMDKSGDYVYYVPDTPFVGHKIYNVDTGVGEPLVSSPSTGEPDFQPGHNDTGTNLLVGDDQWHGGVTSRQMSAPHVITLAWVYAPYWINYHVSMRANDQQWGEISTYGEVTVSADPLKYKEELIQVGVQPPATGNIRRLVHNRAHWSTSLLRTVTAATNASPIVITTSTAHGFQTGQRLQMSGITGNTAANGFFYITVINSTQFSLNNSASNGVYASGGQAYLETYWDTPRANVSRDGRYIFWTSNWDGIPGGSRKDLYIAQIIPPGTGAMTVSGKFTLSGKATLGVP
jgi:fibronectin type III domain protein